MTETIRKQHRAGHDALLRKLKGLWKLLFGRTTIFVLLLLIQAFALFGGFVILGSKVIAINYGVGFISVLILVYLLNSRSDANFKLMWVILIAAVPVFGVTLFLYTRIQPGTATLSNRIDQLLNEQKVYLAPARHTIETELVDARQEYGIFKYIYEEGHYPSYENASVKYFPLGEDKFAEMVRQLERAEKFIFLEYFIIDKGLMWDAVLEILKRKARQGVEVRLMYDGTCTLSLLPLTETLPRVTSFLSSLSSGRSRLTSDDPTLCRTRALEPSVAVIYHAATDPAKVFESLYLAWADIFPPASAGQLLRALVHSK